MKKYLTYITEHNKSHCDYIKESRSLKEKWFDAIMDNNISLVKNMINDGIDVNIKENHGYTGLIYAIRDIRKEKVELVKLLLEQPDIDVNYREPNYWWTAFMTAVFRGYKNIIKLLLEYPGIDINCKDTVDLTTLLRATERNYIDIIKILLQQPNIDVKSVDVNGRNFIDKINKNRDFLKDYDLQKKILENGREDIIIMFDKYGLVNDKIKEENIELFQANIWGLI
jgi:ankyrin repeat protein